MAGRKNATPQTPDLMPEEPAQVPAVQPAAELPAVPDMIGDIALENLAGAGFENMDKDDYAIPYLTIIQKVSPQVDPLNIPKYIEGAKPGDFVDSVSNESFGNSIEIIPCAFMPKAVEWVPRSAGGGFVEQHDISYLETSDAERNESGKYVLPNGNELHDTRYYLALVRPEGQDWRPMILALASTQIKKSKALNTKLKNMKMRRADGSMFTPPIFTNLFRATTVGESNDKGSWYGWQFEYIGMPEKETLAIAFENYQLEQKGQVKMATPGAESLSEGAIDAESSTGEREI